MWEISIFTEGNKAPQMRKESNVTKKAELLLAYQSLRWQINAAYKANFGYFDSQFGYFT